MIGLNSGFTLGFLASSGAQPKATGGIITFSNGKWIHTFIDTGQTFTPLESITVDAIVVAGGYGGQSGTSASSGSGGSGGRVVTGTTTLDTSPRTITVGYTASPPYRIGGNGLTSSISGWLSASGVGVTGPAGRTTVGIGANGSNGTTSSISGSSYVYGSSGGAGGFADLPPNDSYAGGTAGTGAGDGGRGEDDSTILFMSGYSGVNYGSGGGGGGRGRNFFNLPVGGPGGRSVQGVVIISYDA